MCSKPIHYVIMYDKFDIVSDVILAQQKNIRTHNVESR